MDAPFCQALFYVPESQEEIAAIHPASVCDAKPRALMEYAGRRPFTCAGLEALWREWVESAPV